MVLNIIAKKTAGYLSLKSLSGTNFPNEISVVNVYCCGILSVSEICAVHNPLSVLI